MASMKPRATASPSPTPPPEVSSRRWKASNIRSRWSRATPGPWSTTRTVARPAWLAAWISTGDRGGECSRALATTLATTRSSRPASATAVGRSSPISTTTRSVGCDRLSRAAATTSSRPTGRDVVDDHAGLDAAHVEQVGDEAVEAVGLLVDGPGELVALVGRPVDVVLEQAGRRGLDGRERAAQVVGDGAQDGRAQLVGLGPCVRLLGGLLQLASVEGVVELGGERVQQTSVVGAEPTRHEGQGDALTDLEGLSVLGARSGRDRRRRRRGSRPRRRRP